MSKKIAHTKQELPKLQEGYVRVVHITKAPQDIDYIRKKGLNYEKYGLLSSTARWWGDENEVEYFLDDARFKGEGAKAVVMDIPEKEARVHCNLTRSDLPKAPGVVPPKYLVGILDVSKEGKREKPSRLERNVGGVTTIIGVLTSLFFLSSNLTGNMISNLSLKNSNIIGIIFFFIGVAGGFFYFRNRF